MEENYKTEYVLSLINSEGWKYLLLPFIKDQIEMAKDSLLYATGKTVEEEIDSIRAKRSIVHSYSVILETIDSWVSELNLNKRGGIENADG